MRLTISSAAEQDLAIVPEAQRTAIVNKFRLLPVYYAEHKLTHLKIHHEHGEYAYRCGKYRIFCNFEDDTLIVTAVRIRGIAYRPERRGNYRRR